MAASRNSGACESWGARGPAPGAASAPPPGVQADLRSLALPSAACALFFLVDNLASLHIKKAMPAFSFPSTFA